MGLQAVFSDGNTTTIYEHAERAIEVAGIPLGGWTEWTGGGVEREGQTYFRGAGGQIRGLSNGNPTPQEITGKMAPDSLYGPLLAALLAQAAAKGVGGDLPHQKVEFTLVDQWVAAEFGKPALTIRTTVKIKSEKPDTPNDGNPFMMEVVLKPTALPTYKFG